MITEEEEEEIRKQHAQITVWCMRCDTEVRTDGIIKLDSLLIYHHTCGNLITVEIKEPFYQPDKDKIIKSWKDKYFQQMVDYRSQFHQMKNCENCKVEDELSSMEQHSDDCPCHTCENLSHWKLKEVREL